MHIERRNPNLVSVLPTEHKSEIGKNASDRPILRDAFGRRFHSIDVFGEDQMLLTRILKGVLPVCDVVFDEVSRSFLSYEISSHARKRKLPDESNMKADEVILHFVFGDKDHVGMERHNAVHHQGEVFWFDFAFFGHLFWNSRRRFDRTVEIKEGVATHIIEKVESLKQRFHNAEGLSFITKIVESIMILPGNNRNLPRVILDAQGSTLDQKIESFWREMLSRLENLEYIARTQGDRV